MIAINKDGDMFQFSGTLVNPVNCDGISGGGLALLFKQKYPEAEAVYQRKCKTKELKPGVLLFDKFYNVLFFPTKDQLRYDSKLSYITSGLKTFARNYKAWDINRIAFPALGSGLGGLDWAVVLRAMQTNLEPLTDLHVEIYEPKEKSGAYSGRVDAKIRKS